MSDKNNSNMYFYILRILFTLNIHERDIILRMHIKEKYRLKFLTLYL